MVRFIVASVLSLVSVAALGAETIDLGPSDWRKWDPRTSNHSLQGLRTSHGHAVRIPPGTFTVNRNPVVPYGSIGNGLKSLARLSPGAIAGSAAMSGLFYAMDWVFQDGEWAKLQESPIVVEGVGWTAPRTTAPGSSGVYSFPSPQDACSSMTLNGYEWFRGNPNGPTSFYCGYRTQTGQTYNTSFYYTYNNSRICPNGATFDTTIGQCVALVPTPLTDGDFTELTNRLPTLPAGDVGGAVGDLQGRQGAPLDGYTDLDITGPSSVTGPSTTSSTTGPQGTETSVSTTTTNISYGPTTITTTNTTTTNNYTNGQPSGTTTTTETPSPDLVTEPSPSSGSTSLDIPTDCEFMPTVCAFLDWFKEPVPMPEPDLPVVVDHDFEREYEMNLTAECPPPYTVDTQLFGTLSISWQPFCDLATLMKPLVVGSAFLLSAFITLGIGRGKS